MGNYFVKVRSRQTMCALLNELPDWFFGPRRRIVVNQAVLNLRQEMANSEDDWDSALDFSLDSTQTLEDHTNTDSIFARKPFKTSRTSCCCQHSKSNHQLDSLQEEMRLLREQIAKLLDPTLQIEKEKSQVESPENLFTIPVPPPLPAHLCSTPINKSKQPPKEDITEDKPNMSRILQDLTNVKLKPVQKSPTTKVKSHSKTSDIRSDLYAILKRRYAAMHSPGPKRFADVEGSDAENSFVDTSVHIQRRTVMMY